MTPAAAWHAPLEGWSALTAMGSDAAKFLNSFCTQDIAKLAVGGACEALFTDVKARVLTYATVARLADEHLVVLLTSPEAEALRQHLDRYLIRERVELVTLSEGPTLLVAGQDAPEALVAVPMPAYGAHTQAWFAEPNADALLVASGSATWSAATLEHFRIERGIPLDRIDVDARNFPQELDRDSQTISFTKGCYLGQEPVARIDALGRVNWLLRRLRIEGNEAPPHDAEVTHEGKPAGRVTSAISTGNSVLAMGYVRREHASAGTRLLVGKQPAEVVIPLKP